MTSLVSSARLCLVISAGTTGAADGRGTQKAQSAGAAGQSGGGLQPCGGVQPGGASGQPGAGCQIRFCARTCP